MEMLASLLMVAGCSRVQAICCLALPARYSGSLGKGAVWRGMTQSGFGSCKCFAAFSIVVFGSLKIDGQLCWLCLQNVTSTK